MMNFRDRTVPDINRELRALVATEQGATELLKWKLRLASRVDELQLLDERSPEEVLVLKRGAHQ